MKVLVLAVIYLLSLAAHADGIRIVSDFDDTLKRSNIPDAGLRTVRDAGQWIKAYTGMPELYTSMELYSNGLYILSASPTFPLKPFIKSTMNYYDIPYMDIFTRSLSDIGGDRKEKYKIRMIESVLQENEDDELILLGDDVEVDPQIYKKVEARNPDRVAQIYIRRVLNKELPEGIIGFHSAFEIAANEYEEDRLDYEDVQQVANAILNTSEGYTIFGKNFFNRMDRVIPEYGHCPKTVGEFNAVESENLAELEMKVQSKIIKYCKLDHH